jgi:hypothetical protein
MAKQTFTTGQVLTAAQMTSLQQTAMLGGAATAKTANYVLVAADAGTTVAMNAAGATTITVNTGLFAAGDTVFIQNLGAGACTVTAGTATVATAGSLILPQNDAGILYFTATGASIFYDFIQAGAVSPLTTKGDLYTFSTSDARLGVGANNTVLTADSAEATGLKWATPTASSTFATDISVNGLTVGKGTASVATNTTLGVDGLLAVTTGSKNTAIGHSAGKAITTAVSNVLVGTDAGKALTTGGNNTIIGEGAGILLTNGNSNVVVGHDLLNSAVTGVFGNTVLGEGCAISMTSGYYNVVIGQTALESQTSANYNVAIGNNAGTGSGGGANNIYIGNTVRSSSGADVTNIGPGTGNPSATYTNVTNIGKDAAASSTSASNTITLGDANITSLRCQVTSITSLSDERDKKNISPLDVGLDFVNTLKPVSFDWNMRPKLDEEGNVVSTGKIDMPDIGFIAQDMVKAEDDLGLADYLQLSYRDNPDALEVSQGRLIPILVKAIQDLSAKIEMLENK